MENEKPNSQAEQEVYPLDDATAAMLAEIDRQAIALNGQRQGALILFLRQHKLQGNWRLAENGRELVKDPAPAVQPQS